MYRPIMQNGAVDTKGLAQGFNVFVRSKTPLAPEAFFESIRQKLLASDRDMIVYDNESEVVADSIASQRFSLILLGAFAGLALLLAALESMACSRTWSGSVHGKSVCAWRWGRSGLMYCAWCCKTERA
jgi:hypothetical protein